LTIIDTSVMVAFLKGLPDAVDKIDGLLKTTNVSITIITYYELIKGASLSLNRQENLSEIKKAISNMGVMDLSFEVCAEAAEIYRELKEGGCLIGEFDIIIAAIARANHEALLTHDKHFKCIKGLELANW
jgi:tRNA(fMet)-specific endonuclease VapC